MTFASVYVKCDRRTHPVGWHAIHAKCEVPRGFRTLTYPEAQELNRKENGR